LRRNAVRSVDGRLLYPTARAISSRRRAFEGIFKENAEIFREEKMSEIQEIKESDSRQRERRG